MGNSLWLRVEINAVARSNGNVRAIYTWRSALARRTSLQVIGALPGALTSMATIAKSSFAIAGLAWRAPLEQDKVATDTATRRLENQ